MKDNILTLNQCRKSPPMSSSTDKRKPCIEMKVGKNSYGILRQAMNAILLLFTRLKHKNIGPFYFCLPEIHRNF